jgi:hypothetical protein
VLLWTVHHLVSSFLGEHVYDVQGIEPGSFENKTIVFRIQLTWRVVASVLLIKGTTISIIKAYENFCFGLSSYLSLAM